MKRNKFVNGVLELPNAPEDIVKGQIWKHTDTGLEVVIRSNLGERVHSSPCNNPSLTGDISEYAFRKIYRLISGGK